APRELLETMATARIHLDAMTPTNGPLQVIPCSHKFEEEPRDAVTLLCDAGDVLLMRPLISHASGHSSEGSTEHRRIVHLEFAPSPELPDDYRWHDFVPLEVRETGKRNSASICRTLNPEP